MVNENIGVVRGHVRQARHIDTDNTIGFGGFTGAGLPFFPGRIVVEDAK